MTHPALIERITRSLAYMLRHQPEQFDLELDEFGYAPIDDVVHALNERLGEPVEVDDVRTAVESGDRVRYELKDDAIRALYGHSIDVKAGEPSKPPELLFVGVSRADAERALRHGLRAGRRRYLHLALSADDALETARRTADDFAILTVHALDAWEEGINFYDRVALFLSDPIPTQYLELADARGGASAPRAAHAPRQARVEAEHDTFGGDEPRERFDQGEGDFEGAHEGEGAALEGALAPSSDEPAGDDAEFPPADAARGQERDGPGGARRGRRRRRGGRRDAPAGGGGGFAREGGEPDFRRPPTERPVHAERAPSFERAQPVEGGARGFGPRGDRDGGERRFDRPQGERRPDGPRGPRPGEPRHEHPRHAPAHREGGDTRREHGGGRDRHSGDRFQGDRPAREPHSSERFGRERDEGPRAPREGGSRESAPPHERHGFERRDERRGPPPMRSDRPERGPAREERFARGDRPQRDDRPMRDDRPVRDDRPAREDRPLREDRPFRDERPARDDRPRHDDRPAREDRAPRDDRGPRGGGRDRGGRDSGGEGGFGVGVDEAPAVREPRRESAPPPPPPAPPVQRQERPVREPERVRRDDDGGGFGAGL